MSDLTMKDRADLTSLLTELQSALAENRAAKFIVDGNGVDFTGAPPDEARASMIRLRDEVKARLAGIYTPTQALGEAIESLRANGEWP